jgi:hypothetical protein
MEEIDVSLKEIEEYGVAECKDGGKGLESDYLSSQF